MPTETSSRYLNLISWGIRQIHESFLTVEARLQASLQSFATSILTFYYPD